MRACIHRGAEEVGGTCVEVEHEGRRILLDLGLPLDADAADARLLPPVSGLREADPSLLGVVVSHPHPDHYGLLSLVHSSVAFYMGAAAERVLQEAAFFSPVPQLPAARGSLRDQDQLTLGPFTVTPIRVDHSAVDSYALMIEAGGGRLLYSGDFRGHGGLDHLLDELIVQPPQDIDCLLLEGTRVGARASEADFTEADVETAVAEQCRETCGAVLACFSPQNIDRLRSMYRAACSVGRTLVLDLYSASIAAAVQDETLPTSASEGVRIYVPDSQRIAVKRAGAFERVSGIRGRRIYLDELTARAGSCLVAFRGSMLPEFSRAGCLEGASAVWSMWPGYLAREPGLRLCAELERRGIARRTAHASGHASVRDLQRMANAVAARQVVPIHTADPERFNSLFRDVVLRKDGQWWSL